MEIKASCYGQKFRCNNVAMETFKEKLRNVKRMSSIFMETCLKEVRNSFFGLRV